MQFKLRSVNTKFWEDPFIEELKPDEKLIFLYFLTNPLTNMIGIYEITVKRISYDTGLTSERVLKALKVFESKERVYYQDNYVILPNFLKNQNLNTNMQTGALKVYNELPNWLKIIISEKPLKAFESLRNAMLNMNKNMNSNVNMNNECEKEKELNIEFDIFWNLYDKKTDRNSCEKKWDKLKDSEREEIVQKLPAYIQSTPDKKFRKNPETYLNQKGWEHEIIQGDSKQIKQFPTGRNEKMVLREGHGERSQTAVQRSEYKKSQEE